MIQTIILADGAFPEKAHLLDILRQADRIVCCDGAAQKLVDFGGIPDFIVGDMDSLSVELKVRFKDRIVPSADQETNDLTKAVEFCMAKGFQNIAILGAAGLREDHTLGNLSLLADYSSRVEDICLLTDYGRMDAMHSSKSFESVEGQQVSIFSLTPQTRITAQGLLYPIEDMSFTSWWQGTLNQATGSLFRLDIDQGCLLVYRLDV